MSLTAFLTLEEKRDLAANLEAKVRLQATQRLIPFCQYNSPLYKADPIHHLIAEHLESLLNGDIKKLMVFSPPQIGKSWLTGVHFPAFWLGHNPHLPIIMASYAADLAEEHSRGARTIIEGDAFQELFPGVHTRQDSRAANRWHIMRNTGGMRAIGVGGGIAGHPAGLGLIDDPIRGSDWAFSETQLKSVWDWYNNDFTQRLWEHAPVILTMTRWAQNDLAGRILNSKDAKNWTVLRIPALSETQEERDKTNAALGLAAGLPDPLGRQPGITCVPSRYSTEYYVELRDSGLEWRWSAIYMGAPHPPEGNEIKRSWYKIVDELPATLVGRIRYWDKGNTEGGGCRTAGVLLVMDAQGVVYVADCVAGQWGYAERNDIVKQTAQLDAMRFVVYPTEDKGEAIDSLPGYNNVHIYIEREGGAGGKESNELSIKDLAGFPVYDDIVSRAGNKDERLSSFISYSKAGNVRLLRGAWNEDWLDEAAAWPHGYKDRMDATGGAYRKLRRGGFGLGIAGG